VLRLGNRSRVVIGLIRDHKTRVGRIKAKVIKNGVRVKIIAKINDKFLKTVDLANSGYESENTSITYSNEGC
jgi:hypothetical protein